MKRKIFYAACLLALVWGLVFIAFSSHVVLGNALIAGSFIVVVLYLALSGQNVYRKIAEEEKRRREVYDRNRILFNKLIFLDDNRALPPEGGEVWYKLRKECEDSDAECEKFLKMPYLRNTVVFESLTRKGK